MLMIWVGVGGGDFLIICSLNIIIHIIIESILILVVHTNSTMK